MADITTLQSGNVGDRQGKVNWRGDQTLVPQGGQSIYESSSVQLADLGARLVVGDRVFRYAQLGGVAATPGDLLQCNLAHSVAVTGGGTDAAGGKTFTFFHTASGAAENLYAEGYLYTITGTTAARLGLTYRVKTHPTIATDAAGVLTLYDALQAAETVTDLYRLVKNPYKGVTQNTAGTAAAAGVLSCPATTNDYVWIQTWGPCAVKASTAAGGANVMYAGATGAVVGFIAVGTGGVVGAQIGQFTTVPTASNRDLGFLMIAP